MMHGAAAATASKIFAAEYFRISWKVGNQIGTSSFLPTKKINFTLFFSYINDLLTIPKNF